MCFLPHQPLFPPQAICGYILCNVAYPSDTQSRQIQSRQIQSHSDTYTLMIVQRFQTLTGTFSSFPFFVRIFTTRPGRQMVLNVASNLKSVMCSPFYSALICIFDQSTVCSMFHNLSSRDLHAVSAYVCAFAP